MQDKTFLDVFPTSYSFFENWSLGGLTEMAALPVDAVEVIYNLLTARYGNSHITGADTDLWKKRINATIFQYAPTWYKNLEIQKKLRELQEDDILSGSQQIANHAYNPSTQPQEEVISEINEQNTIKYNKSKLDGYALLASLLDSDVTEEFILRFRKLFITVILPDYMYGED